MATLRRALLVLAIAVGYMLGTARFLLRASLRREGVQRAECLLKGTALEGQHLRIARLQSAEQGVQWALNRVHPCARDLPIQGLDEFDRAGSDSRGAILAVTHTGWVTPLLWLMARAQRPYTALCGPWYHHSTAASDRQRAQVMDAGLRAGAGVVFAGSGAYAQLEERVRSGAPIGIALDMPGSLETTFCGKPTRLGQAAFRISWTTGAKVVIGSVRRRGTKLWVELGPVIDPSASTTYEEHVERLSDALTADVMRAPQHYLPTTISTLWPDGSAENAQPNRELYAAHLEHRT